jgi:hypothetical protein
MAELLSRSIEILRGRGLRTSISFKTPKSNFVSLRDSVSASGVVQIGSKHSYRTVKILTDDSVAYRRILKELDCVTCNVRALNEIIGDRYSFFPILAANHKSGSLETVMYTHVIGNVEFNYDNTGGVISFFINVGHIGYLALKTKLSAPEVIQPFIPFVCPAPVVHIDISAEILAYEGQTFRDTKKNKNMIVIYLEANAKFKNIIAYAMDSAHPIFAEEPDTDIKKE